MGDKSHKIFHLAVIFLLFGVVACLHLAYAGEEMPTEYEVKAAFIYHFADFIDWPPDSQGGPGAAMNLCIFGQDPFGRAISEIEGETMGDKRRIVITYANSPKKLNSCHVVFISASEKDNIEQTVSALGRRGVLTIGDTEGFAKKGVIITFFKEGKKIRFEINIAAAQRAQLKISSKLLRLARIVSY